MKQQKKAKRGIGLRLLKPLMLGRYKRPDFIFLDGQPLREGAIILSNHAGTDGPLSLEFHLGRPVSFWGAHEMCSGLIPMYKYQSRIYYHQKKHWNLHLARLFCLIAAPLTNLFYSGLSMIPTYHDARFVKTLRESIEHLKNRGTLVIFPEDSSQGYKDQLDSFLGGCTSLMQMCQRRGMDVPVYVSYFRKSDLKYIFDRPVMISELLKDGVSKEALAQRLCDRCNELGRMTFDEDASVAAPVEKKKEKQIV